MLEGIAPDVRKQLDFLFDGKEVNDLQQIVFLVANDGERSIRDVIEPLALTLPPEVELLDASVVHRQPDGLKADIVIQVHPPTGIDVKFKFPLLNKREFFVVKLLLSGRLKLENVVFRLLADDLPRTIQITPLPPAAYRAASSKFEWSAAIAALLLFVIPAWILYSAKLLQRAYPMLFPYPGASFVVSAKSLFLVIAVVSNCNPRCATFRAGGDQPPRRGDGALGRMIGCARSGLAWRGRDLGESSHPGVCSTIFSQRFSENPGRDCIMTAAEREILRLERRQVSAFNGRDLEALLDQFASGFVGFSSTRFTRIAGRTALKKTFEHYLDQSPRLRYRITQPRVQVFDGTAVASFYWTVELSPGQKIQGRGSHVLMKHGGRWSIVHEHFSRSH